MTLRFRLLAPLALLLTLPPTVLDTPARAFDLEDYAATWRATRDAWRRALNEAREILPQFLAIQEIAASYGLDIESYNIPLGSGLRPDWCDTAPGEIIGHPIDLGLGAFAYSGSFDFYGRGHGRHHSGKGVGHHHDVTAPDLDTTTERFLDLFDPMRWYDSLDSGSSAAARQLVESDLTWYEDQGVIKSHCQVCVPCPADRPCNTNGNACSTDQGEPGQLRWGDCPPVVECDSGYCCPAGATCEGGWGGCVTGDGNWVGAETCPLPMTVAEALEYFKKEYGFMMATQTPNMCVPEWQWGGSTPTTPPVPYLDEISSRLSSLRSAVAKSLHELNLATPPFRAATAAYAAVVETYAANTPCGTWLLPNMPDLPNPFEPVQP